MAKESIGPPRSDFDGVSEEPYGDIIMAKFLVNTCEIVNELEIERQLPEPTGQIIER